MRLPRQGIVKLGDFKAESRPLPLFSPTSLIYETTPNLTTPVSLTTSHFSSWSSVLSVSPDTGFSVASHDVIASFRSVCRPDRLDDVEVSRLIAQPKDHTTASSLRQPFGALGAYGKLREIGSANAICDYQKADVNLTPYIGQGWCDFFVPLLVKCSTIMLAFYHETKADHWIHHWIQRWSEAPHYRLAPTVRFDHSSLSIRCRGNESSTISDCYPLFRGQSVTAKQLVATGSRLEAVWRGVASSSQLPLLSRHRLTVATKAWQRLLRYYSALLDATLLQPSSFSRDIRFLRLNPSLSLIS